MHTTWTLIQPWFEQIFKVVRKDLKQEHLLRDSHFCTKFFLGKHPRDISLPELIKGYDQAIGEGHTDLAEFISARWVMYHPELYHFFEKKLSVLGNFTDLKTIDDLYAWQILEEAISSFGSVDVYLFSVMNAVVFSPIIFEALKALAEDTRAENQEKLKNFKVSHKRYQKQS